MSDKPWYCPICGNYFADSDPGLFLGKCPECGSTCTYLGAEEKYHLEDAILKQLSRQYSLPVVHLPAMDPLADGKRFFSRDDCLRVTAVPVALYGDVLVVAVADPELFKVFLSRHRFEETQGVHVRLAVAGVTDIIAHVLKTFQ